MAATPPPPHPATPPPQVQLTSKIEITKIIKAPLAPAPKAYLTGKTYAACMSAFAQNIARDSKEPIIDSHDSNESISQIAVKGTQEVENDESVFTQK